MTEYIGNVAIPAIESVSLSKTADSDEYDLANNPNNVVLFGSEDAQKITINYALIEGEHPSGLNIEDQRDELKTLPGKSWINNDFSYLYLDGYVSVEGVDLSESSTQRSIRRGSINGIYLPYPKYR